MYKLKFKTNLLLSFVFIVCIAMNGFSQVQTTFTEINNIITVKAKPVNNSYNGLFTSFSVVFRYLNFNNVSFTVTSSTYSPVSLLTNVPDPIDPNYSFATFGFSSVGSTVSWSDGTEYPMFSFQVNGGLGTNPFSLSVDYPDYLYAWTYYQLNSGTDITDYTTPFYAGTDNLAITTSSNWLYASKTLYLGKYWLTNGTSDWSTNSNWSGGTVPVIGNDIAILPGGTQPIAGVGSVCNNLSIESGASLQIAYNGTLTINGALTIADDNSLVVKSTASGTGSIITNGIVPSGNKVSLERFIANDNAWHFLSSPINGQAIKPNFAPTVVTTNFDFYKWDESKELNAGLPWLNIRSVGGAYASGFDNFVNGKGYLVAYSSAYVPSATKQFSGTLNNGNLSIAVTYSNNHYNLLGNPYPSAIDWTAVAWGSNRDATLGTTPNIWIWNQNVGNYGTIYGPLNINGASNIIAPNQGFFVEAIAGGSFTMPNAVRVHPGAQPFLKSTPSDLLKLHVSSTANTYSDELIVNFDANTTSQGTAKWFSMLAEAPSLYSVKNSTNYTITTFTGISSNLTVPVAFKAGVNGMYTITASELNSFATSTYIYLKDLNASTITDLNQNASYSFAATTSDYANRFQLIFSYAPLSVSDNVIENTTIYSYDNTITVNSNESIQQIYIYNTLGQLIKTVQNTNGTIAINMDGNTTAYYIVKVITSKNVYSEKVLVK